MEREFETWISFVMNVRIVGFDEFEESFTDTGSRIGSDNLSVVEDSFERLEIFHTF